MISIKSDDSAVRRMIEGLLKRLSNMAPAMRVIGEIVHESIQTNFEEGGRPKKWEELKSATIKQREKRGHWPGRILVESGVSGGLMGSITYKPYPKKVVMLANKKYAAIHHFGGKAGRGRQVTIPARPYMMVQDEDWREIEAALGDFIVRGKA